MKSIEFKRKEEKEEGKDNGKREKKEEGKEEDNASEISVDWVKEHLSELTFKNIELDDNYQGLTKEDNKITNLLKMFQKKVQKAKPEGQDSAEQETGFEQE